MKLQTNLFKTTPMSTVYGWLKTAKEKKQPFVVIAYNKQTNEFLPVMCNDINEARAWAKHYNFKLTYENEVMIVDTNAIRNLFGLTNYM
jgi:hypothetical protein